MPKSVASERCTAIRGYDQPEEYNIYDTPLIVKYPYQCCNECAKVQGNVMSLISLLNLVMSFSIECKSWVYKEETHECFLKNTYDASKSKIECDDCIAYDPTGDCYQFQSIPYAKEVVTFTSRTADSDWATDRFGQGSSWAKVTGSSEQTCTFTQGYNQPEEHNMEGSPLYLDSAYQCCAVCMSNKGEILCSSQLLIQLIIRVRVMGVEGQLEGVLFEAHL